MNIGIYGGTFDPPHVGHVTAAKAAMEALHLDKLLLIPDRQPPHKALAADGAGMQQRYDMTVLAATLNQPTQGVLGRLDVRGIGFDNGLKLAERFLQSFRWEAAP